MNAQTHLTGTCPVCNGSGRIPGKPIFASYDPATGTIACNNCGGQYQYGTASGIVRLRPDGEPCRHDYKGREVGRCLNAYTCTHCGDRFTIDSGD